MGDTKVMQMPDRRRCALRPIGIALLVGAMPCDLGADEGVRSIDDLAPHAAGLSFAEIVDVKQVDDRGGDGSLYLRIRLKTLASSGYSQDELHLIQEFGGHRPPGDFDRSPPKPVIAVERLKVGERVWFAFAPPNQSGLNPDGVINAWPDDDRSLAATLRAAIDRDYFQWQPHYDPKLGLTFEHRVSEASCTIRVREKQMMLWSTELPGIKSTRYPGWRFLGGEIWAQTATPLGESNEYGLAADTYYIQTIFHAPTGRRIAVAVSRFQSGSVILLERFFADDETIRLEVRYDWTDGKWLKQATSFRSDGKPAATQFFYYDAQRGWIKRDDS